MVEQTAGFLMGLQQVAHPAVQLLVAATGLVEKDIPLGGSACLKCGHEKVSNSLCVRVHGIPAPGLSHPTVRHWSWICPGESKKKVQGSDELSFASRRRCSQARA